MVTWVNRVDAQVIIFEDIMPLILTQNEDMKPFDKYIFEGMKPH